MAAEERLNEAAAASGRPGGQHQVEEQLAVLERIRALRDRIARRVGETGDVIEALDRSRQEHP